jgi:hypothetical protein
MVGITALDAAQLFREAMSEVRNGRISPCELLSCWRGASRLSLRRSAADRLAEHRFSAG